MSKTDGLYPAIWFECQSPLHDDLINEFPEDELWRQAIFHRSGEHITQQFAMQWARRDGWKKVKGQWICPICLDEGHE